MGIGLGIVKFKLNVVTSNAFVMTIVLESLREENDNLTMLVENSP